MKRRYPILILVLSLIALALAAGCPGIGETPGPLITDEFNQSYPVGSTTSITVENVNGDVRVNGSEGEEIQVQAIRRTQFGRAELDRVSISVTQNGVMTVRTVHPSPAARVSTDYTISVPLRMSVTRIVSSNGQIFLDGVQGNAALETSNGRINVSNHRGDVSARSSNGEIRLTGVQGAATARTSNAPVIVEDTAAIAGIETSNGIIRAEVLAVNNAFTLQTSNARIDLMISPFVNADLDMSTSNGQITISGDVPTTARETTPTRFVGSIGSGGPVITVRTSNGNINVTSAPMQ